MGLEKNHVEERVVNSWLLLAVQMVTKWLATLFGNDPITRVVTSGRGILD
jgi:hypothetical protein